jgi:hypothetical protein
LQPCKALLESLSIRFGVEKAGLMLLETYLCRICVQNRCDTFHVIQATSTAKLRSRCLRYLSVAIVEWHEGTKSQPCAIRREQFEHKDFQKHTGMVSPCKDSKQGNN